MPGMIQCRSCFFFFLSNAVQGLENKSKKNKRHVFNPLHQKHLPQAGRPHPMPTNKYTKKITTTTRRAINLTFFHHILLRSPRLLIRKSCAFPPNRSVLSTSRSMRSPRSRTRSIFSVMISRTLSISFRAEASASAGGAVLYVFSSVRSSLLNAAQPYAGREVKSVIDGG